MHLEENANIVYVLKLNFLDSNYMCLFPLFCMFYRQFSFIHIVPNSHPKALISETNTEKSKTIKKKKTSISNHLVTVGRKKRFNQEETSSREGQSSAMAG